MKNSCHLRHCARFSALRVTPVILLMSRVPPSESFWVTPSIVLRVLHAPLHQISGPHISSEPLHHVCTIASLSNVNSFFIFYAKFVFPFQSLFITWHLFITDFDFFGFEVAQFCVTFCLTLPSCVSLARCQKTDTSAQLRIILAILRHTVQYNHRLRNVRGHWLGFIKELI